MYYDNNKTKHVSFSSEKPISGKYKRFQEKADREISRAVRDVKEFEKKHPLYLYGGAAGLLGAGIGATTNVFFNKNKKKSKLRKLLEGGLIGGIAGAGLGAAGGGIAEYYRDKKEKREKENEIAELALGLAPKVLKDDDTTNEDATEIEQQSDDTPPPPNPSDLVDWPNSGRVTWRGGVEIDPYTEHLLLESGQVSREDLIKLGFKLRDPKLEIDPLPGRAETEIALKDYFLKSNNDDIFGQRSYPMSPNPFK